MENWSRFLLEAWTWFKFVWPWMTLRPPFFLPESYAFFHSADIVENNKKSNKLCPQCDSIRSARLEWRPVTQNYGKSKFRIWPFRLRTLNIEILRGDESVTIHRKSTLLKLNLQCMSNYLQ